MALRNYKTEKNGMRHELMGVSSVRGNSHDPNPFYFKKLVELSPINLSKGWSGVGGRIQTNQIEQNGSSISYPSAELGAIMTDKNRRVESKWPMLDDRCMGKIYEQIRGNSEFVVDFAERSQTLKMLKSSLMLRSTMKKFVSDMLYDPKRKRLPSARKRIDYVSSKWLEYRYGWMPLIGSVYDAADNLRRGVYETDIRVKARASASGEAPYYYVATGSGQFRRETACQIKGSFRREICAIFRPPSPTLQETLNWTSLNPLSIAWELVPLSFVADWFVNVGDQLRAWENHTIYNGLLKGGYETYSYRETREGRYMYNVNDEPINLQYWPNGQLKDLSYGSNHRFLAHSTLQIVDRRKLLSLPRPSGFALRVNLNAKRVADAAALSKDSWKRLFRK